MYVPYQLRQEYNFIYMLQINNQIDMNNNMQTGQSALQTQMFKKPLPKGFDFQSIEVRKHTLNKHLKIYIEGITNNSRKILAKTFSQKLLDLPPAQNQETDGLLFYKDFGLDFQTIFFQGNEVALMVNFICVYNAFDLLSQNTALSLLLTYILQKTLLSIKKYPIIYTLVTSASATSPRRPSSTKSSSSEHMSIVSPSSPSSSGGPCRCPAPPVSSCGNHSCAPQAPGF